MPGGMVPQPSDGDLLARIQCKHGNWFSIRDLCETTQSEEGRELTARERRKFERDIRRMLRREARRPKGS